LELRKFFIAYK
jgi:hypothetical protein